MSVRWAVAFFVRCFNDDDVIRSGPGAFWGLSNRSSSRTSFSSIVHGISSCEGSSGAWEGS